MCWNGREKSLGNAFYYHSLMKKRKMSQLQILIDKAHFFSQTSQSLYITQTQFVFSIGRLSSARRDHVVIAEHYGMPPFAVFFFLWGRKNNIDYVRADGQNGCH